MSSPDRDLEILREFGIWPQVLQIRRTLRHLARIVRAEVDGLLGSHRSITPEDCVRPMATSLEQLTLVRTLLRASLYSNESAYPKFLEMLARCVLHHFWSEISR